MDQRNNIPIDEKFFADKKNRDVGEPELAEMLKEDYIDGEEYNRDEEKSTSRELLNRIAEEKKTVYRIKVIQSNATEFCIIDPETQIARGEYVIAPTRYGKDMAIVLGKVQNADEYSKYEILILTRKANQKDLARYEENKEKDKKAFNACKQKALEHKLDMKLVSAHYLLDESKILFFFTADARVDFRELVKDLVSIFKTRIELRQIGVRDESRVVGGLGMCGRGFCCNTLTDKLNPVSIKMAKEQNLSLNSLKISGACGRLLCCLAYEYSFYKETREKLPYQGTKINYNNQEYVVEEINVFKNRITLRGDGERLMIDFSKFHFDDQIRKWVVRL